MGSCKIEDEEQEQEFLDDVASLEDSICGDDEPKDVDRKDWIDLCENINIYLQTNLFSLKTQSYLRDMNRRMKTSVALYTTNIYCLQEDDF